MFSESFLKGFRSAVQAYGMNTPHTPRVAYDAQPSFTPRTRSRFFTRRTRATDQQNANQQEPDDNRPLSDELMQQLHTQLEPDTFLMLKDELKDALNGAANDQDDPDQEDDQDQDEEEDNNGLSPDVIDRICALVGPHLSDDDFEKFQRHLGGMSGKSANDQPPPFSGRFTPGGGHDPVTSESRARSRSPAEDANRILPLAYDDGIPFSGTRNGVRYVQGKRVNSRSREPSTSSLQSYAKRFPDSVRIRHV